MLKRLINASFADAEGAYAKNERTLVYGTEGEGIVYFGKPDELPPGFADAVTLPAPGGRMEPMRIPPIVIHKTRRPVASWCVGEGKWIHDFGQNLAGVLRVRLPKGMTAGQTITITGVTAPKVGNTPTFSATVSGSGFTKTGSSGWYINGVGWNDVTADSIYQRMAPIKTALPQLWEYVESIIAAGIERGYIRT